ncbi:MAG TPA: NAD-glutamate dehydrogenase [Steroidobacteraceae bacterium]|nr:NAD-glutamate dehydrogenase [Steroidobacteraceae bacterium]
MTTDIPAARVRLIERIVLAARHAVRPKRLPALAEPFLRAYYHGVAQEDLAAREPGYLAAAALHHLRFGDSRPRNRPLVRVFSPSLERDGFTSPHTLVLVVTRDMPFLVDSLGIVFSRASIGVHLIAHPVLAVERHRDGRLQSAALAGPELAAKRWESWQLFEIDRQLDRERLADLERRLLATLNDVRAAVLDWSGMRARSREVARKLGHAPVPRREIRQARALLEWMDDNHFTFLGYRYYRLRRGRSRDTLAPARASGLGILRTPRQGVRAPTPTPLTGELRKRARAVNLLTVTKANSVATVHRATYLDYVGVKTFGAAGEVTGEHRFIGLWTSSVYDRSPREIPVLSGKIAEVIERFRLAADSHDAKAVLHALETFPRDELFQATVAELVHIVRGTVNLYERALVRLFLRRDEFERFYSCLVYVPRDRYNTDVRGRIEAILRAELGGREVETQVQLSESTLARLHVVVRTEPPVRRGIDVTRIERAIAAAATTWADRLRAELATRTDEAAALATAERYTRMFPAAYTDDVEPRAALADIADLDALERDPRQLRLSLHRPERQRLERVHLKVVKLGDPVPISDILPMMENFGLRVIAERPYELAWAEGRSAWIQDFELEHRDGGRIDIERIDPLFREGFIAVWCGDVENDGFNRLLLGAGLAVREIVVLRAYCRYLLQTGVAFSQAYMERVLTRNPGIARNLFRLFAAQLDPRAGARGRPERLVAAIRRALDAVGSLDEDRILRAYLNVIGASIRTNFFQRDAHGKPQPYLAVKLDPKSVPDLPLPRPKFEIFVYSPRVEAVHLRMAYVSRGGIRWSDRREDFRTEILGLMKAQNVKNTVIVPMGAKGGFVVKRPPAAPADLQGEVIECYRTFMRGLLDLTDNIVRGEVVPPPLVVRRDAADVYLVVAADKGTAAFSDIANAISAEYGYWLGDAFASGGSAGYDHKQMGITARGAWECVKRHFRELGVDIQRTDFAVAGIGDMSGDVFGNGMLLSRHILLRAAFNHQHIFLDPAPDARRAFAERARLFALPRSSWDDYDRRALSRGGGIHARSAKSIALSREAQAMLGLGASSATPQEVIRAILKMPVDLLWNGGIGTYVKASSESHLEIGDRTNDGVRVNGAELGAKVVGEGGNLGLSQRGRIEYALHGGRLNTDFIDNSAGVNTSDVEVNIKILLNPEVQAGRLRESSRRRLLASMTDEVAQLVLRNNYLQSQALSTLELHSATRLAEYQHLIRSLERSGDLNRAIEFLPEDEELAERRKRGVGLTRPELSVVLSYSKIWLSHHLLASDVPEDPYLSHELERYFPLPIRRRFGRAIAHHRLRREIIATATTNSLINRMGPVFVQRAQEDTGAEPARIARAYTTAREIFDMRRLWAEIEALDNRAPAKLQYTMMYETSRLLRHMTYWLLGTRRGELKIDRAVAELRSGVRELSAHIAGTVTGIWRQRFDAARQQFASAGAPADLADRIASLDPLNSALDLVELAAARRASVVEAAHAYFEVGTRTGIDWLRDQVEQLPVEGAWQATARTELRYGIYAAHRRIAERVLGRGRRPGNLAARVSAWQASAGKKLEHWQRVLAEMRAAGAADFATLSVGLESVRKLAD